MQCVKHLIEHCSILLFAVHIYLTKFVCSGGILEIWRRHTDEERMRRQDILIDLNALVEVHIGQHVALIIRFVVV